MYNHQLDAFIKTAELGSFSKAADAMYISSPALIQQINLLEGRCGFALFARSHHGVTLTPAGRSLYEDAKTLIQFSKNALEKAGRLAEASQNTVRVGTSLLYKCRALPDLWSRIGETHPDWKLELLPMGERETRGNVFSALGSKYDLFEGIYASISFQGLCQFVELGRTPLCCAVAKNHRLAKQERLTMADLNGEYLVMPIQGVSQELDDFRKQVLESYPTVQVIDSSYYGLDTFTLCEVEPYVLITQEVYRDIHTNLVTIPLETDVTLPYGLMTAKEPTPAARQFLQAVQELE